MTEYRSPPRAAVPALMFALSVALATACGGSPEAPPSGSPGYSVMKASGPGPQPSPSPTTPPITCPDFASTPSPFPADLAPVDTAEAGTIPGSFSVSPTGEATYTMPLATPPGRAGIEPHLSITYSSGGGNGLLGMGFAVSGLSSITRCPSNLAQDGVIREVRYDAADHFCLDGRRLVPIATSSGTVEYRTFPDTFTRIVGHFLTHLGGQGALLGPTSFEVDTAAGLHVEYGTTPDSRVMATGAVKRAWLAAKASDKRGNFITYTYWNDKADDGHTREHAPHEIRYTGHDGDPVLAPSRAVRFNLEDRDARDRRTSYTRGMALRSSKRLASIDMLGPGDVPVRTYNFGYGNEGATGRTVLQEAEECAADGVCKPSTRFSFTSHAPGFQRRDTGVATPFSNLASPMLIDVTGDGLDDLVVPDIVDMSDPISSALIGADGGLPTFWNVAKNGGAAAKHIFGAPTPRAITNSLNFSIPPNTPTSSYPNLAPEVGTAIDFNQDGRTDIFYRDRYSQWATWQVLLAQANHSFKRHDTGVPRPAVLALMDPNDPQFVYGFPFASIHLADVDGNGVPDLIQCEDGAGGTVAGSTDYRWTLHLWTPSGPGWDKSGSPIDALYGYPCNVPFSTVDLDGDGKMELLVPGADWDNGGHPVYHETYDAMTRDAHGAWARSDTRLPYLVSYLTTYARPLFLDVNGDGLPDAISDSPSGQLFTFINTGDGFAPGVTSLLHDVDASAKYISLAQSIDYDGDGRRDLLIPMPPGVLPGSSTLLPSWAVLRSTGDGFEMIDPGIPLEPILSADGIAPADPRSPRVGDVNGDGAQDVLVTLNGKYSVFQSRAADQDLLQWVADGMNEHDEDEQAFVPTVSLYYEHLVDRAITDDASKAERDKYTYLSHHSGASNTCTYPRRCAVGPMRVVYYYAFANAGKARSFRVKYRDGRYHALGRGFLGFGERVVVDQQTEATAQEVYDNVSTFDLPNARDVYLNLGQVMHVRRWSPGLATQPDPAQIEMSFEDVTPQTVAAWGDATYFSLPTGHRSRRVQGHLPAGETAAHYALHVEAHGGATTIRDAHSDVLDFDAFGNALSERSTVAGTDVVTEVTRTFENRTGPWLVGLLRSEDTCSSAEGQTKCRTTRHTYDVDGQIKSSSANGEDGNDEARMRVQIQRDAFGNVTHVIADEGIGLHGKGERREVCTSYEPEGIFPFAQRNPAGHLSFARFDLGLGVLLASVDPNGLAHRWAYDAFGRPALEARPDGTTTTRKLKRDRDGLHTYRITVDTQSDGGGDEVRVLDSLGRTVRRSWHGPQLRASGALGGAHGTAATLTERIEFDPLGERVARRTLPTSDTLIAHPLADTIEYDAVGRVVARVSPWKARTTYTYAGRTVTEQGPDVPATVFHHDALGRAESVVDPAGGITSYAYGPFGTVDAVTLPDLTATSTEHDAWGRVTRSYDPDRGITESHYNGFGDLVWTEDAASRKATFFHDALGRRVERIDEDHGASTHTTWTWDTAPLGFNPSVKAIGMLAEVASPDARNSYAYDDLGRLRTALQIVGGEPFAIKLDYDTAGRVGTIHYPAPMDGGGFAVRHDYDAYGHLVAVRDAGAPSAAYWQFTETDHAGRLHAERFGNGVETRRDYDDGKQRVKAIESTLGGARIQALSYDYDDRLNLTHRHDALQTLLPDEGFLYDDLDRLKCAYFGAAGAAFAPCSVKLEYDAAGNIKHKSDVGAADYAYSDPTHPHAVTEAGGKVYGYDAIGNQTSRPGGVTVTYTAFDLPKTITRPAGNVDLGYDGDQHRVLKSASGGDVTVYVADLYERVTHADGSREQRYYVHAGGRVVAIVTGGGATPGTRYVHTDNLGSIDVLTDEAGSVAERKSFDAFGARRNPKWHSFAAPAPSTTTRGFTGHEDEEDLGLVNMKGRIYDPKLGRFLTPDPVVSRPHDGQSWNPYSYVLNNPLAYTDPSGFDEIVAGGSYANDAGSQAGTIVQHIIGASAPAGSTPTAPAHPPTQGSAPAAPAATAAPPSGPGRPPPPPPPPPPQPDVSQALAAGAAHPPVDVSTLGSNTGHDAQPQTTSPTPSGLRFAGGVALGVATGAGKWTVEAVKGLALNVGTLGGYSVYKFWSGVYHTYKEGGVVGVVNSINPLYGIGRAGADIYLAIDKGDPVAIGQAAYTAIGVVAAVVVGARAGAPRGGTYGGVRKAWQRQGGEVHHMPSWNAQQMAGNSPFTHRSAPGIMMDVAHHRRTASWGSAGARYREAQAALLRDGRFLDALAADIANVESIAPGVYTDAMRQMAEHLWSGEW